MTLRIGIDLDNTIIHYDDAFLKSAIERGLLSPEFKGNKQQVRDAIRTQPDGETQWQMLQGFVYGQGLHHAKLFEGFPDFMRRCKATKNCDAFIVSHKTEFGHFDPERVNLRDAARAWMKARRFFDHDGFALPSDHVYFKSTRAQKILKIIQLQCDIFIDDLEEVLADPRFPQDIRKILFSTNPAHAPNGNWTVCHSWAEIERAVFDAR